jgi:hypothetical protein
MPNVEGRISGIPVTDELRRRFEAEISETLRETISQAFPTEIGYAAGSREWETCRQVTYEIMPGWTWVSVFNQDWAMGGKRVGDDQIAAYFQILVLENALWEDWRQACVTAVRKVADRILGEAGKPVHIFVSIIEGPVDMSLPSHLFSGLLNGERYKLLQPAEIVEWMKAETASRLAQSAAA